MLKFFKGQARNIRGLNSVPGLISLLFWGFSLVSLWIDHHFPEFATNQPFKIFHTDYETAKSVLSTVAAASITTLGLVYSIVLVVFTTAAGNIGPRLLQRFTSDGVNQFTAGLFGGTFLYSLTVLHQTDSSFVPAISISITFFLAGLSVLQLIYFVHKASRSVTIDEEVADIATQLETGIQRLVTDAEAADEYTEEIPDEEEFVDQVLASKSGYITFIDIPFLVDMAKQHELFLKLNQGHGSFIIPGVKIAELNLQLNESDRNEVYEVIRNAITISESRSPDSDVEFSTNLLIEIALRALSPGVNDTFTAITCIDRISSALVRPVQHGLRDHIRADEEKVPRIYLPGLTLDDLINGVFHPLRRASTGNVLMTKHLLDALERLHFIGDKEARSITSSHAESILASAEESGLLEADIKFLSERYQNSFQDR